jgi:hypothetical protein
MSRRVDVCYVLSRQLTYNFLSKIVTGDETWCFQYHPESKRQSLQWKQPTFPRPKQARKSKSQIKVIIIIFFDVKDIVHFEFIPQGQSVSQSTKLIMWKYSSGYVKLCVETGQNFGPTTGFSIIKMLQLTRRSLSSSFWPKKSITEMEHQSYSPDLAPNDFWLFTKIILP